MTSVTKDRQVEVPHVEILIDPRVIPGMIVGNTNELQVRVAGRVHEAVVVHVLLLMNGRKLNDDVHLTLFVRPHTTTIVVHQRLKWTVPRTLLRFPITSCPHLSLLRILF